MNHQTEIDAAVETYTAEKAETAKLLSRAQSYSKHLWQRENLDEDEFNAKLIAFCRDLCGGNELMGLLLASAAEWPGRTL